MAPRKTAGWVNFTSQLDKAFPERKKPDGWIADEFHEGVSDHHPDDTPGSKPGWDGDPDNIPDVRAADVSANLGSGVKLMTVCHHLAELPRLGTVIRYFIHGGLIWHVHNDFKPVKHDGDPHPSHLHVSFAWTEAADDNTTFNYQFEEVPMALSEADFKKIEALMVRVVDARIDQLTQQTPLNGPDKKPDGTTSTPIGHNAWNQGIPNPFAGKRTHAWRLLSDIADKVNALVSKEAPK